MRKKERTQLVLPLPGTAPERNYSLDTLMELSEFSKLTTLENEKRVRNE